MKTINLNSIEKIVCVLSSLDITNHKIEFLRFKLEGIVHRKAKALEQGDYIKASEWQMKELSELKKIARIAEKLLGTSVLRLKLNFNAIEEAEQKVEKKINEKLEKGEDLVLGDFLIDEDDFGF